MDPKAAPCQTVAMFEHQPRPEWIAVEEFLSRVVVHPDPALQQAISSAAEAGMPAIEVAPNAGKLLKLLVQLTGARRVLEIGTLAGFSTIWMGRGLPSYGTLVTCEFLPKHAEVAWANIDAAGLGEKVEIRLDNAVWEGAILDPAMDPVNAPGIIGALELLGKHPRLDATVIQTVGSKGWDGFALGRIR
jgi:predicted O-methyltransferase YrrM